MLDDFGDLSEEERSIDIEALVKEYEDSIRKDTQAYFDEEQLSFITDYYFINASFDQAMQVCERGLVQFPHSLDLLLMRAQLLVQASRFKEAHETIDMAELFNPSDADVQLMRATVHTLSGNFVASINILEEIVEQVPIEEKENICFQMAQTYVAMGELKKAVTFFKECIEINVSNEAALYELLFCLDELDQIEESLPFYQKFIDKDPYSFSAWFNLGVAYSKLERFAEAIKAYTYATDIKEDLPSAWFNMGNAYMNTEVYERAVEAFLNVERYEEATPETLTHLAASYEKLERYEVAIKKYQAAIAIDELWDDAWYGVASCLYELDKAFEAISFVKKAIELNEFNPDYLLLLGDAESAVGNTVSACEAYEKASVLDPEYPDVWLQWSEVFFEEGDFKAAADTILEGIDSIPDEAELFYRAAVYLIMDKRFAEAYNYLEIALTLNYELHTCIFDFFPDLETQKKLFKIIEQYKK
jgi:tetratricopeptide (TPR) repeat protein